MTTSKELPMLSLIARTQWIAGFAALASVLVAAPATAQIDDRVSRLGLERSAARRVFSVAMRPDSPVELYQVEEVRQQLPPHRYAVRARNRSADPIASYTSAAVVVGSDGTAKAFQPLPPVRNLKPNQARRQEIAIKVAVLNVTDRVAFVVTEVTGGDGQSWKAADEALRARIKEVAYFMPLR
jgi:hypothetical protein